MTNKVAIVTGGTRGIGRSISEALVKAGYKVAAFYHGNEEAAKQCETELGLKAYKVDVTDYEACAAACAAVEADLGAVAVLVNNAGITRDAVLHKMTAQQWHEVVNTNMTSLFNTCRAIVPGMRDRGFGRIVNISSINGQKGQFGQTNYSAAKAGMIGFTKALALENAAKGITVNAIAPGYIETDMTASMRQDVLDSIVRQIPAGRMGRCDEIAGLVAYLASDSAGFINGATIAANGGQYMS